MPKVQFTSNFNYAQQRVTTAYKAGMKLLVTTACAKAAIAAGRAVAIEPEAKTPPAPIRTRRRK